MVDNVRRNRAYGIRNALQKLDTLPIIAQKDPSNTDFRYPIGQHWINQTTNNVWILTSITASLPNWEPISEAAEVSFPISLYIVDADGSAGYTTIQAAMDAANTAGIPASVYVRPGTYTENLTFYSDINLIGDNTRTTIVSGVHIPEVAAFGTTRIFNIRLRSTTDVFNTVTAGTGSIILKDCEIDSVNGHTFDLPFWAGSILYENTRNVGGASDGFIDNSSGSTTIQAFNSTLGSPGGFGLVRGNFTLENCILNFSLQTTVPAGSITGLMDNCIINKTYVCNINSDTTIRHSTFATGADQAITQQSPIPLKLHNVVVDSTNITVVGGTTNIEMTEVVFPSGNTVAPAITLDRTSSIVAGGLSFDGNTNIMSEYRTDVWTPQLEFGGATTGITYANRNGRYIRIGDLVTLFCWINLSSKGTAVGGATITGNPFTVGTVGTSAPFGAWSNLILTANYTVPSVFFNAASTVISLDESGNNVVRSGLDDTNFNNGTEIFFQGSYRT